MSGFSTKETYEDQPIGEKWHPVRLTKVEYLPETNENKAAAQFRWHILAGDDQGRWFYQRLVLIPAPFGYGVLAAICRAIGVEGQNDDPDNGLDPHNQKSLMTCLLNKPLMVRTANSKWRKGDKSGTNTTPQEFRTIKPKELARIEQIYDGELPPLPDDYNKDRDGNPLLGGMFSADGGSDEYDDNFSDDFSDDDIPF